jgi:hypothetical protein
MAIPFRPLGQKGTILSAVSKLYIWTTFGQLKSCGDVYHVSHTCTLRKPSRTRIGVHISYGRGNSVNLSSSEWR